MEGVGPGTVGFAIGDEVFGRSTKPYFGEGTFAEFMTTPTGGLARKPSSLSHTDAAALLVALWAELTDERPLVACATLRCPGSFVLAHGRLYCDACQAKRRQEDVRSSRAKAADRGDAD